MIKDKFEAQAQGAITAYINLMIYFLGFSYYMLHNDIGISFLIMFAVIPVSILSYKFVL